MNLRRRQEAFGERRLADNGPMSSPPGLFTAEDGRPRCFWCAASPAYRAYHDSEWGFPVGDDRRLFEKLCLEGFQAGPQLAHDPQQARGLPQGLRRLRRERVARFGERDVARLLGDAGIVRHRGKIESTINNARRVLELREEFGSLAAYAWRFEPRGGLAAEAA